MTEGSSRSSGSEGLEEPPSPFSLCSEKSGVQCVLVRGWCLAYFHIRASKVSVTASVGLYCWGGEAVLHRCTWWYRLAVAVVALVHLRERRHSPLAATHHAGARRLSHRQQGMPPPRRAPHGLRHWPR